MKEYFQAVLNDTQISAQKARLVADLVRKKPVTLAVDQLSVTNKKAARLIYKLIKSAVANAVNEGNVDADRLHISEIFVDEGKTLKRFLPRAQGRATPLRKRSSHITLRLREI